MGLLTFCTSECLGFFGSFLENVDDFFACMVVDVDVDDSDTPAKFICSMHFNVYGDDVSHVSFL